MKFYDATLVNAFFLKDKENVCDASVRNLIDVFAQSISSWIYSSQFQNPGITSEKLTVYKALARGSKNTGKIGRYLGVLGNLSDPSVNVTVNLFNSVDQGTAPTEWTDASENTNSPAIIASATP